MSTTNSVIATLTADFAKFQTDTSKFFSDSSLFYTNVQLFLKSLSTGATGTTLSAADAATLTNLDAAAKSLDLQSSELDQTLTAIVIPTPPPATPTP